MEFTIYNLQHTRKLSTYKIGIYLDLFESGSLSKKKLLLIKIKAIYKPDTDKNMVLATIKVEMNYSNHNQDALQLNLNMNKTLPISIS